MTTKQYAVKTVRPVAPEDLRPGMYLTVMRETLEFVPMMAFVDPNAEATVRSVTVDACAAGEPVRVEEVCLPFVLVTDKRGASRVLDLRCVHVARVAKRFARAVFDAAAREAETARGREGRSRNGRR